MHPQPLFHSLVRSLLCYLYPTFSLHNVVKDTLVRPTDDNDSTETFKQQLLLPQADYAKLHPHLVYWAVLAFCLAAEWLLDAAIGEPFLYDTAKLVFFVWLSQFGGYRIVYRAVISRDLSETAQCVTTFLDRARGFVSEALNR